MHNGSVEQMALMIPILFVLGCCALPTIYFLLRFLRRKRLFELYHEERMAAIAKGIDLPPLPAALLHEGGLPRPKTPGQALLRGLIWLFIGAGLFMAMRIENRQEGIFALVPIGVGLAYLVYYLIEGRRTCPTLEEPTEPSGSLPLPAKT